MIQAAFEKHWAGTVRAEFQPLPDMKISYIRAGDNLTISVSDIIQDAPQEALEELAERVCLRINGNTLVEPVGCCLSKWLSENLSTVRGRLRAIIEPSGVVPVGEFEIWFTDAVNRVEVREKTKLVLAPAYYLDAPEEVLAWLYDCAKAGKRVKAPSEYFDWLWDKGRI